MLLFSALNTFTMDAPAGDEGSKKKSQAKSAEYKQIKKDRDTQKMIALMAGSALAYGATHYLSDRWGFSEAGNLFNVSRKAIRAGFGLSGTLAGLSVISSKKWSERFRSAALRVWLMPFVGGVVGHPKVHEGLSNIPWGIGEWFKANPPTNLEIGAIYTISTWALLKPSIDKVENRLIERFADKV